jgi:hypothetical protein
MPLTAAREPVIICLLGREPAHGREARRHAQILLAGLAWASSPAGSPRSGQGYRPLPSCPARPGQGKTSGSW